MQKGLGKEARTVRCREDLAAALSFDQGRYGARRWDGAVGCGVPEISECCWAISRCLVFRETAAQMLAALPIAFEQYFP